MSNSHQPSRKLSQLVVFQFAAGSFGVGLLFSLANTYFIYFVTDVALVPAGIMATVFTCTRIFDFCCTPIIAGFVQNGRFKLGKYRSWILYIVPVTSFFTILCFARITGNPVVVAIYYGIMYLLAYGLLDKPGGAQRALMTRMAQNDRERMMLTARSAQFEQVGNIVFSLICLPLIALIGQGNEAKGYLGVAVLFGLTGLVCYYTTAHAGKDYDIYYDEKSKDDHSDQLTVKQMMDTVFKNPPLICCMLIEVFRYLGFMIYVSTMAYYFKWFLGDMSAITTVATAATAVCFISSIVSPHISNLIGRKNSSILAMCMYAAGMLIPRFFAEGDLVVYTACICLAYFGAALQVCVGIVMYSKAADYHQWKTGLSAHGFVMSIYVLPVEIGIAFSVIIIGIVLNAIGYDPAAASLTASQLSGLKNLVLLIPGILFIIAAVIAALMPLSEKKISEMEAGLKAS